LLYFYRFIFTHTLHEAQIELHQFSKKRLIVKKVHNIKDRCNCTTKYKEKLFPSQCSLMSLVWVNSYPLYMKVKANAMCKITKHASGTSFHHFYRQSLSFVDPVAAEFRKGKGTDVPVPNEAQRHEDVLGSGGIAPHILDLGTRWS
jgi:hypothetical protein